MLHCTQALKCCKINTVKKKVRHLQQQKKDLERDFKIPVLLNKCWIMRSLMYKHKDLVFAFSWRVTQPSVARQHLGIVKMTLK